MGTPDETALRAENRSVEIDAATLVHRRFGSSEGDAACSSPARWRAEPRACSSSSGCPPGRSTAASRPTWPPADAQLEAFARWGISDPSQLVRVAAITHPTFVAGGDDDTMMITENSALLAHHLPAAQLRIYPDVRAFLNGG